MLKSFTALVAFLCLGPPSLPSGPPAAPKPDSQVACLSLPAEVLQSVSICELMLADPITLAPTARNFAQPVVKVDPVSQARLELLIKKYAQKHGVDEKLVQAVLRQESGGNPLAISPKGAMGLMQLMPETAESLGVQNAFDPAANVAGGVRYLKLCLRRFQQNVVLALAAYNAGPEAVEKYGGVPPYQETENYVAIITAAYTGKSWTRDDPAAADPAPVKEKAGLDWNVPKPKWKIADPRVKVGAPQWKVKSPELPQAHQPKERQISYNLKLHGLKPKKKLRSGRTIRDFPTISR
jgi:hypothetical protein